MCNCSRKMTRKCRKRSSSKSGQTQKVPFALNFSFPFKKSLA